MIEELKQEKEKLIGDNNYLRKKAQSVQSENDKLSKQLKKTDHLNYSTAPGCENSSSIDNIDTFKYQSQVIAQEATLDRSNSSSGGNSN